MREKWETEKHPGGAEAVFRRVIQGRGPGSANGSAKARQTSKHGQRTDEGGAKEATQKEKKNALSRRTEQAELNVN